MAPPPQQSPFFTASTFWEWIVVMIAALAAVPAQCAGWEIGTTRGTVGYLAALFLGGLFVVLSKRAEDRRRDAAEKARDDAAEDRFNRLLKGQEESSNAMIAALRATAAVASTTPNPGNLIRTIQVVGSSPSAGLSQYRQELLSGFGDTGYVAQFLPVSSSITSAMQEIAASPPRTPEEIKTTEVRLEGLRLRAEPGEFKLGGGRRNADASGQGRQHHL